MKYISSNISDRIDYALNYSQVRKLSALALEIGVDESAISRWKKTGNISIQNARILCSILDISMDWMILGRGEIQQHKKFYITDSEREIISELRKLDPQRTTHIIQFLRGFLNHNEKKSQQDINNFEGATN